MCKEGLLNELKQKLINFDVINERGTFGETILHVSILYKQNKITKYLIKKYPKLINEYYLNDEYYGETALHMTVINRDYQLTKYLLENGANPNTSRATGRFFDKNKGTVYYGEHPITFAIATFQSDLIQLLYKFGANLNVTDCFGNSVFHHCVRVNSPEIFDILMDLYQDNNNDISLINEIKNDAGFSILQYAVELGKKKIFDHILEKMKIIGWEWGDVSFYAYPITEIDTHGDNTHSVLETIITQNRSLFILNPVIYEVLLEKWNYYGQTLFILWFILHIIYCIFITITFLTYDDDNYISFIIISIKSIIMTMIELHEFYILLIEHKCIRAWNIYITLFKIIEWFSNILSLLSVIIIFIINLKKEEEEKKKVFDILRGLFVFIMLCEWLENLMFLQSFKSTGRLVVTISKILTKDVTRFVFIYIIILCSFSSSLSLLTMKNNDQNNYYYHWTHSMFIMFEISLGMGTFFGKNITNSFDILLTQILYIIFLLLSVVLLFNLLIAIMTETTEEVRQQANEQWLLQWASTVLLIERRVPKCIYKRTGNPGIKFGFNQNNQSKQYFITFTQTKQYHQNNLIQTFRQSTFVKDL